MSCRPAHFGIGLPVIYSCIFVDDHEPFIGIIASSVEDAKHKLDDEALMAEQLLITKR